MTIRDDNVVEVNGKIIDARKVRALTVGDARELARRGVDVLRLRAGEDLAAEIGVEGLVALVYVVARRANDAVVEKDVDDMTIPELAAVAQAFFQGQNAEEQPQDGVDRPT